jgi:hypothetical protein
VDVARYIARVKQWARVEKDVAAATAKIFRSQFLDARLAIAVTDTVLPSVATHVATIDAYTPATPEVGKIHARYVRAWRRAREGLSLINRGMREDDGILLAQGRRRLEVWQEEMQNVAAALRALAQEVGLSPTESATSSPRASSTAVLA